MAVNSGLLSGRINLLLPLSILIMSFGLISWNSLTWEDSLRKESALLDTVMQLKFDLARTHAMLHEESEGLHGDSPTADLTRQIRLLRQGVEQLTRGYVTMGGITESIGSHAILEKHAAGVSDAFEVLLQFLSDKPLEKHREISGKMLFDDEFSVALSAMEQVDQDIHEDIYLKIKQKHDELVLGLTGGGVLFGLLLLFLLLVNRRLMHSNRRVTQLMQALEHSGEAVIITDHQAIIQYVSPSFSKLTGYSTDEALGRKTSLLSSGKQPKEFYERLWATLESGNIWNGKLLNKRKDGSLYWALMTIAPIFDEAGNTTNYVANQQDITEFLALESRVFEANKMDAVGTLAAGIAHEFNNELAAIIGNLALIERKALQDPDIAKYIQRTRAASERAADHVKRLLDFSRRDTEDYQVIDLVACAEKTCALAKSLMPPGVELHTHYEVGQLHALWVENQLHQALINLINNAAHALEGVESPRIDVTIGVTRSGCLTEGLAGPHAIIHVSDNGCGIPEALQEKVFNPFYTTKEVGKGTGLGLAVVYGMIRHVGGVIRLHSAIGQGTTFRILIPLYEEARVDPGLSSTEKGVIASGSL